MSLSTYSVHEFVLHQKLQSPSPEHLLWFHGRLVVLKPLLDCLLDCLLELVIGSQLLLGPFREDARVDSLLTRFFR